MPVIIDGTGGITFPNSTVQASAGQVLQVVNATYSTQVTTTTSTYVTTGLTASITPKFSNSKILVIASINGLYHNGNQYIGLKLYRNSGSILTFETQSGYAGGGGGTVTSNSSTNYLDSPATTSSTSYTVYFNCVNSGGTIYAQVGNESSTITLMEIAA